MAGGESFVFKQFIVRQDKCAMKVGTDAVLLGAWADLPSSGRALDIGTGTGIIALMVAQRSPLDIDAIEIDENAHKQALHNCSNSKWNDRLKVHHKSFQDFYPKNHKKFNVIISNPPYFSNSAAKRHYPLPLPHNKAAMPSSHTRTIARHACLLTFDELLTGIKYILAPGGVFATILPARESEEFIEKAVTNALHPGKLLRVKTTGSKPVKRVLMQFTAEKKRFCESTLIIEKADHSFTSEYKALTRDFYLGF